MRTKRDNAPQAIRECLAFGKDSKQSSERWPGGEPGPSGGGRGTPGHAVSTPYPREALTSWVPISLEPHLQGPSAHDESHPWPSRKSDPGHQGTPAPKNSGSPFPAPIHSEEGAPRPGLDFALRGTAFQEKVKHVGLAIEKEIMDTVGTGWCGSRGVEDALTPGMYFMVLLWL